MNCECGSEPGAESLGCPNGGGGRRTAGAASGAVGFSPDGRWLMTTGGHARLWRVGSWEEGPKLGDFDRVSFAFQLATGARWPLPTKRVGTIRLLTPDTGRENRPSAGPEPSWLWPVCFSPDGSLLVSYNFESSTIHLVRTCVPCGRTFAKLILPGGPRLCRPQTAQMRRSRSRFISVR